MSIDAMTWAYSQTTSTPLQKFVLVTLGDRSNDAGVVWVSRRYLSERCSMSMSTVKRNLDALEDAGFIRRRKRDRENGSHSSNVIVLAPLHADRFPLVQATSDDLPAGVDEITVEGVIKLTGVGPLRDKVGPERPQGGAIETPPDPKEGSHIDPKESAGLMKLIDEPSVKVAPKQCLTLFNEIFKVDLRSEKHLKAIAARIKEYGDLALDDHRAAMEAVATEDWWQDRGAYTVNIVYSAAQFPRAVDAGRGRLNVKKKAPTEYIGRSGTSYRDKRSALQIDDLQPGDSWNGITGS